MHDTDSALDSLDLEDDQHSFSTPTFPAYTSSIDERNLSQSRGYQNPTFPPEHREYTPAAYRRLQRRYEDQTREFNLKYHRLQCAFF